MAAPMNKSIIAILKPLQYILSCSEEFQGISFFYNYETQELTKVFTCSVKINAALISPFT